MTDLQAVLGRGGVPVDRVVSDLVAGARSDVASVLGLVVAGHRAIALGAEVKAMIRDIDKLAKAYGAEREELRPQVVKLDDQVVRARGDLEIARRQKQRVLAGVGGEAPDVAAVEVEVRALEREREQKRIRLRTVTSKGQQALREKGVLADLLHRLEAVPVGDPDVLSVLGSSLAEHDKYN